MDVRRVVHEAPVVQPGEAPPLARHDLSRPETGGAYRQHVVGMPGVGHRIGHVIAMSEGQRRARSLDGPIAAHEPLDRSAAVARDRRTQPQQPGLAGHVELPADPDEREVQAHQESIAEVLGRRRIEAPGRAIEVREQRLAAAIAHLQERRRPARRRPSRPQDHEIRGGLHAPARVAGGAVEIDDGRVGGMRRIELDLHGAAELLVVAAQDVLTRAHEHPSDLGAGAAGGGEEDNEDRDRGARGHRRA